jgi:hypothetical protein
LVGVENKKPRNHTDFEVLVFFDTPFAEEEGFEPPEPCGSTVFKTAAFDRSATPLFALMADLFVKPAILGVQM